MWNPKGIVLCRAFQKHLCSSGVMQMPVKYIGIAAHALRKMSYEGQAAIRTVTVLCEDVDFQQQWGARDGLESDLHDSAELLIMQQATRDGGIDTGIISDRGYK